MVESIKTEEKCVAIILMIAVICGRPMILSNLYSAFSLVLFAALILYGLIKYRWRVPCSKKGHLDVLISSYLFIGYCFFQGVILGTDQLNVALQTLVYLLVTTTAFYMCFLNKHVHLTFIKILYAMLIFFSLSYMASLLLMFANGWKSLFITNLDYGYFAMSGWYFPFTLTYGEVPFNGLLLKRMLGFARESGIMQIFYIWAFFMTDKYFRKKNVIKCILAFGVVACLSTAGFIVFGISMILYLDIKKIFSIKTIVALLLVLLMVYILFFSSGTSLSDKAAQSVSDRDIAIQYSIEAFKERPIFGHGIYDTMGYSGIQFGINAISSIGQLGLAGILLWINIYFTAFRQSGSRKRFVYANVALMITALFSQPMIFAPVMYWFLFSDYGNEPVYLLARHRAKKGG